MSYGNNALHPTSATKLEPASDDRISQMSEEVNNLGNTLSEGQQEYFKDSKVRDENGNLKVMYHGTYFRPFTIFNPARSDDGRSLFFTDNEF